VKLAKARALTAKRALELTTQQFTVQEKEIIQRRTRLGGEIKTLQQTIENLEAERKHCEIRASADGTVGMLRVQAGSFVQLGEIIATIVDPGGFRIDAAVNSADVGHIRPGLKARIKLQAFDFQKYGALDAVVSYVSPDSGMENGTAFYIVRMDLTGNQLSDDAKVKLGMLGNAEIVVSSDRLIWVIFNSFKEWMNING
jgi:multidrug resistance efflux pump